MVVARCAVTQYTLALRWPFVHDTADIAEALQSSCLSGGTLMKTLSRSMPQLPPSDSMPPPKPRPPNGRPPLAPRPPAAFTAPSEPASPRVPAVFSPGSSEPEPCSSSPSPSSSRSHSASPTSSHQPHLNLDGTISFVQHVLVIQQIREFVKSLMRMDDPALGKAAEDVATLIKRSEWHTPTCLVLSATD